MPVHFPAPLWPDVLEDHGPAEDPTILLCGRAEIGGAPHTVHAMRVNPHSREPDLLPDVDERIYEEYELFETLEELVFLLDVQRMPLVALGPGHYVVWLVPGGTE